MLTANDTRTPQARAFSLIEVALAVGVISFALVGIIGLFPVAMQSALDSQHETQVALIARSLFSELQRVDGDKAYITVTKPAGGERQSLHKGTLVIVNLGTASSTPTQFYFDESGGMLDANGDAAVYRADVSVNRTGQPTGLSRLDIKIQVPSNAPAANQKSYEFVTLINFAVPPATP